MKEVAASIRNECVLKSCSLMFRKRKVDFSIDETWKRVTDLWLKWQNNGH
jgi:hypothetical protein